MDIDKNAKIIWDFMQMNMPLQKVDAIFVLCVSDTRVAERALDLYNDKYAPWVIVSGGARKLSRSMFRKPGCGRLYEALDSKLGVLSYSVFSLHGGDFLRSQAQQYVLQHHSMSSLDQLVFHTSKPG